MVQALLGQQRRRRAVDRAPGPCFGPMEWPQRTGPLMRARSMTVPVRASKVRSRPDTGWTRLRGPEKHPLHLAQLLYERGTIASS